MKKLILLALGIGGAIGFATPATNPDLTGTGTYTVPATSQELAAVGSFDIRFLLHRKENGDLELHYQLPQELVGPNKPAIILEQDGPPANGIIPFVHGPERESATCRHAAHLLTCFVLYPSLDTDGAEDYVKQKYAGQGDLQSRLEITRLFSTDPIGVVKVPLAD